MVNKILDVLKNKGYECEVKDVVKGGVVLKGIVLKATETVGITVYPELMDGSVEEIANKIADLFEENKKHMPDFKIANVRDWDRAKDKLKVNVRPVVKESDHITKDFLDLQLIVRLVIDETQTTVVTKQLCEIWGKTSEEVFEQAFANGNNFVARTMLEVLMEMIPHEDIEALEEAPMYVVTTSDRCYGAAALLDKGLLGKLADKLDSDLYLIPSSIHEILVINANNIPREEVDAMIREVNATTVSADEVLSDHIYTFSKATGEITY